LRAHFEHQICETLELRFISGNNFKMLFGMTIPTFRLTILALAVLAQLYLFIRARRAIRSSQCSERFKARATAWWAR